MKNKIQKKDEKQTEKKSARKIRINVKVRW